MSGHEQYPVKAARQETARWFGQSSLGNVFVAADGRSYRLDPEEAIERRARAEQSVVAVIERSHGLILFGMLAFCFFASAKPEWLHLLMACHLIIMAGELSRRKRAVAAVRNTIMVDMVRRTPLPPTEMEPLTAPNPFELALKLVGLALLAMFVSEHLAVVPKAWSIPDIPMWAFGVVAAVLAILHLLSRWLDGNRGVGR